MSDVATGRSETTQIFRPATIGLMILVGIVGFFGALVLGTYAPSLEGDSRAGGHAVSNASVGFSGLVRLAGAAGYNPQVLRDQREWQSDDLVVATPESAATHMDDILEARGISKPTLFVLPKWDAAADDEHKGWVRIRGLLPTFEPEGVFAPGMTFAIKRHLDRRPPLTVEERSLAHAVHFATPAKLQVIEPPRPPRRATDKPPQVVINGGPDAEPASDDGFDYRYKDLQPLITDGAGGMVLGRIDNFYLLADPDLLDNAGMKSPDNAASALALLDWLNSARAQSVGFDVVLNGLGQGKSVLRLAFDPPFLAMTLTLAVMVVLLGIRAAGRFGAPRPRQRAIAFGKAALVDNSAMLVRKAGKARRMAGRYAAVVREQAMRAFAVPARLGPAEVDNYLEGLGGAVPFTALAEAAEQAGNEREMLAAARALHAWKREVLRDD